MIKKIFFIGLLLIAIIGLPTTIFLSQNRQDTRTKAEAGTSFSLIPQGESTGSAQKNVGDAVPVDLIIDPGPNAIGVLRVTVQYNPAKLELDANNPFTPVNKLDPPVIQPYFISSGILTFGLSVGTDTTKAIKQVEKAGTFNFKAIAKTDAAPATITFIDQTAAYSVGSNEEAAENVLINKNSAQITIVDPTEQTQEPTATPTPSPIANKPPTCTLTVDKTTGASPLAVNFTLNAADADGSLASLQFNYGDGTLSPTFSDTEGEELSTGHVEFPYTYDSAGTFKPTATVTDDKGATATCNKTITITSETTTSNGILSFTVFLHSIGNSGDSTNPNAFTFSNKNPKHQPRSFTISIFNSDTAALVLKETIDFTYRNTQGNYTGDLPLTAALVEGDYIIKVKTDNFLQKKVTGFYHITPSSILTLPAITLVTGDADGNNKINILDYNLLTGCYSDVEQATLCDDVKKLQTDFNDDELVNEVDVNLFLREIKVQNGD